MKYQDLRQYIESGDTVVCSRRGFISVIIRIFTAESDNHSATLLRDPEEGVLITELREGLGYNIEPASQWIEQMLDKNVELTFCKAPEGTDPFLMRRSIFKTRTKKPKYAWHILPLVWISQLTRVNIPIIRGHLVCSVYSAKVHKDGGYGGYGRLPDPGDIRKASPKRIPITEL